MTTLKLRAPVPFPSKVQGTGGLTVAKVNGIWTIRPDFTQLQVILGPALLDPDSKQVWIYDPATGEYAVTTLSIIGASYRIPTQKKVVATGDVTIADDEQSDEIEIDNQSGGAISVYLPSISTRGMPITITDVGGNAGTFNITVKRKLASADTVMTGTQYVIDSDGGGIRLTPNYDNTGYK